MKDTYIFMIGNASDRKERAMMEILRIKLNEGYEIINVASAGNVIIYICQKNIKSNKK